MATTRRSSAKRTKRRRSSVRGITFSWKRLLGIDLLKRRIAKDTGIPTTKAGIERKLGGAIISFIFDLFTKKDSSKKSAKDNSGKIDENLKL